MVLLAALAISCGGHTATTPDSGETSCQRFCDLIRPQLIENFGVKPNQIDCADSQWDTNDCQQCEAEVLSDFGVQVTQDQACES
jgi:hypothetical protein